MAINKQFLKKWIRLFLYNTFGRLGFRTGMKTDILILTSSRSGSTWLVESILRNDKCKLINQPFDCLFNDNVYKDLLPISNKNHHFVNLTNTEEEQVVSFWNLLRKGCLNPSSTWKIFSKDFIFFYERKLFKVFFLKEKVQFFENEDNLVVLYLIRNPLYTSLSNINYNYKPSGESLIKLKSLSEYPNEFSELKQIYFSTSSILMKYIISWCFENYTPFVKVNSSNNIILIRYEDLKDRKQSTLSDISQTLNIQFTPNYVKSKTFKENDTFFNEELIHKLKEDINYSFINKTVDKYFEYKI